MQSPFISAELPFPTFQIAFEDSVRRQVERETSEYPDVETECVAPPLCHEFQTARLLLSHFGFLSLDALQVW